MLALQKIMELLEVTTDRELADMLGIKHTSTISTWKKRGYVPMPVLRAWAIKYGKPVEWFMDEDYDDKKPQADDRLRLSLQSFERAFDEASEEEKNALTSELFALLAKKRG